RHCGAAVMVARPLTITLVPAPPGERGGVRRYLSGLDRSRSGLDELGCVLQHRQPGGAHAPAAQPPLSALSLARDSGASVQGSGGEPAVVGLCVVDAAAGIRSPVG